MQERRRFIGLSILLLSLLSALAACSSADAPATVSKDAGIVADASTASTDSGVSGGDASTSTADSGGPADAGADVTVLVDAGLDSGPVDSGIDAGVVDSGPPLINGCATFVDATAVAADRTLTWDFAIAVDARRCLLIAKGQTVTFATPSTFHPLSAKDGTTPTPIPVNATTGGVVTFPNAGTYGYVCANHSSMTGAIKVLP